MKTLETLAYICNVQIKHLQHTSETDETFRTYTSNICYSHCIMWNIPIYFCNMDMKHLQRTSETPETKHTLTTCAFSAMSPCCLDEWRLVVAEFNAGAEVGGSAWSSRRRVGLRRRMGVHGGTKVRCGHLVDGWSVTVVGGATPGGGSWRPGGRRRRMKLAVVRRYAVGISSADGAHPQQEARLQVGGAVGGAG